MKEYKKFFASEFKELDDKGIKVLGTGIFALFSPMFDKEYSDLLEQFYKDYDIPEEPRVERSIRSFVYGQLYYSKTKTSSVAIAPKKLSIEEMLQAVKEIRENFKANN